MKRLLYIFVLVTGLLAACSQTNPQQSLEAQAVDFSKLKGLRLDPLYPPSLLPTRDTHCLINPFKMPGQTFTASGVKKNGNGLDYASFTAGSKTALTIGSELKKTFFSTTTGPATDRIIFVVDDFGLKGRETYTLGNALFTRPQLDEATVEALQKSPGFNLPAALSHGALVFREISDEIQGTGLYPTSTTAIIQTPSIKLYVRQFTSGQRTLKVVAVNINKSVSKLPIEQKQSNTELVRNQIKTALDSFLSANGLPASRPSGPSVVINMSFSLVPCRVFADYEQWDDSIPNAQTLEDYMKALEAKNKTNPLANVTSYDGLVRDIIELTNTSSDQLKNLIAGKDVCGLGCSAAHHVYVASAGNYSLKYSMYPANWDNVVNVTGSSVDDPTKRSAFFNQGEVMHIAASLKLDPPRGLVGGKSLYYIGTSFSAPTVTTYSALDLATVKRCKNPVVNAMPLSELAKNIPSRPNPPLIDRRLEDTPAPGKPGAVSVRCGAS